jgi:hypothetical protein
MGVVKLVLLVYLPATGLAQSTNLGPNSSVFQPPPANPVVQSIHPR